MLPSMKMKSPSMDLFAGMVFLIIGAVLLWQILLIPNPDSALLSYFVIALYLAMCVLLIVSGSIGKARSVGMPMPVYKAMELIILGLMILLYFGTKLLSFYFFVFPFVLVVNLLTTRDLSKKNLIVSLVYSACFSLFIFITCRYGLNIVI